MAKNTVSKADLVDLIAADTGHTKKDVKDVVDTFLLKITQHLDSTYRVQLTGFGTFEVRKRKARMGVRPGTTERIQIPESKYPAFRPGKGLKDRVRG